MAEYTIGQWLKGKVDFSLTDANLLAAVVDFNITPNEPYSNCTDKVKDLSLANIYSLLALSSSISTGEYNSDGGWQHRDAARNVVNKGWFLSEAKRLRKKWGIIDDTTAGMITFKNLY